jgi:hypothetical protein
MKAQKEVIHFLWKGDFIPRTLYIATLDVNSISRTGKTFKKATLSPDKNYIILEFKESMQIWKILESSAVEENKIYQLYQEQKQLLLLINDIP